MKDNLAGAVWRFGHLRRGVRAGNFALLAVFAQLRFRSKTFIRRSSTMSAG